MANGRHIIRKTVIELSVARHEDGFKAQTEAANYFKEKIVPMLEKLMDEISPDDQTLRLEKLELDLDKFILRHPNDEALRKLETDLRQKLGQQIKEAPLESDLPFTSRTKKIPAEKNREELFFYLLQNGVLPWWTSVEERVTLVELAQSILANPSAHFRSGLIKTLSLKPARQRILHRLPAKLAQQILEVVSEPALLAFYEELAVYFEELLPGHSDIHDRLMEFALKSSAIAFFNADHFTVRFVRSLNDFAIVKQLYEAMRSEATKELGTTVKQAMAENNHFYLGRVKRLFSEEDAAAHFETKQKENKQERSKEEKIPPPERAADRSGSINNKTPEDEELLLENGPLPKEYDFHIANAGLVILGAYLPAFFKELKLVEETKFVSEEAAQRAAYLLQRLCLGAQETYEEHEMVLNKILCGLDVYEPLTLDFHITEKEEDECVQLLNAVAANWTALKGTSGESMREAFFKREGVLEQQANGWNLKVEKTTIDILLDKLPWGISIIRMPWSEAMIFVNW